MLVADAFTMSDETYGYRRIHAQLARWGVPCGPELVRGIMRELDLQPCQPRPWRFGLTEQDGTRAPHPRPRRAGLHRRRARHEAHRRHHLHPDLGRMALSGNGDRLPHANGRSATPWATTTRLRSSRPLYTMRPATPRSTPTRSSTPTAAATTRSYEFAGTIRELGLRQSVGRTGICYDNAMAESFFAALKNERVHRTAYPTRAHARADIARYIEFWYNTKRLHSGLGYKSPQEALNEWTQHQQAA